MTTRLGTVARSGLVALLTLISAAITLTGGVDAWGAGEPTEGWAAAAPSIAAPNLPNDPGGLPTSLPGTGTHFPTATTAGVPAGWTPVSTINGDFVVDQPGAVVEDLRIVNGVLIVSAPNVTIRRVEIVAGSINNYNGSDCYNGLVIEDSTIVRGSAETSGDDPVIGAGGYTARGVMIDGVPEGFRVGGDQNCGPVVIENSFARVVSPDICIDWHGDALQGYLGSALTLRNTVLELDGRPDCEGNAPFFYPDQGNTAVDIDGLVVIGGGYPFRLSTRGVVRNLDIVSGSWEYGPIEVDCSIVSMWDAQIVTLDAARQPISVRDQPCDT